MNITALGTDGGIIEIQEDTGLASITDGYNDTIVFGESEIEDLYDVLDEYVDDDGDGTCVCGNSSCNEMEFETDNRPVDELFPEVGLETTVSVEGASDEQREMYREMASLVEANFETFVNKNMSYGNSFLNTDVGFTDSGPFDSQLESNANGLMVRMSDKMTRLENLLLSGGEDRVGEKSVETALDLSNYSLMLAYLVQEKGGEN